MTKERAAIQQIVNEFLQAYELQQVDRVMSFYSQTTALLVLGTNENEAFQSTQELREAYKRDFSDMANFKWGAFHQFSLEVSEGLASVLMEMPMSFQAEGKKQQSLFRLSLTLRNEGNKWMICEALGSVPYPAGTVSFSCRLPH